jgi:hypothetical protein
MISKRIYIAGPMTNIPYFNFPMFDTFRDLYKKMGYEVFSPADHDRSLLGKPVEWIPEEGDSKGPWKCWSPSAIPVGASMPTLRDMLGADLAWIAGNATHIAMIPEWENSKGANAEWSLAKTLGLVIHYYPMPHDMILEIHKENGLIVN